MHMEAREEAFLQVEGMHCSNCEQFIEQKAQTSDGIISAEASYATDMLRVEFNPRQVTLPTLKKLFSDTGYTVKERDKQQGVDEAKNNEVARLIIGGLFSMMAMMYYILFLYPSYFGYEGFLELSGSEGYFVLLNIFVMASFVLFYTGYPILRGAYVSMKVGTPNMDLLITIAATGAYIYSIGAVIAGYTDVYFDVTMVLVMVVSIGNWYEDKIKKQATEKLKYLTNEQVTTARRRDGDRFRMVPVDQLESGDLLLVQPGERIPVDGTLAEGTASVNESLISGESLPVIKKKGDKVIGGTLVTDNAVTVKAATGAQNTLDRLVKIIWDIQATRPGAQRLADRLARFFVPVVVGLSAMTLLITLMSGWTFTESVLTSLTVLIVSCPCALGLATPLALASAMKQALDQQVVIKNAAVFENIDEIQTLVFDKTGTLTSGKMHLVEADVEEEVLQRARACERYASHPIAKAITEGATNDTYRVSEVQNHIRGIEALVDESKTWVGDPEWIMERGIECKQQWSDKIEQAYQQGAIPVAVAWDGQIRGILIVGDEIRSNQYDIIQTFKSQGKRVVMMTGDSKPATMAFREDKNFDEIFFRVKPEEKLEYLKDIKNGEQIAMIGDGTNDAPALAKADLGIAFGPTALAADSADVVILDSKLDKIPLAFDLAARTKTRIKQNLAWAFLYNIIAIPLAALGMINPLFAALAMGSSSLMVVLNSSRRLSAYS